jgi:release factor glutamine methyltransferase
MTVTCDEALRWGTAYLQSCGVEGARLDAEVLLAHCLGWDRAALYRASDYRLKADEEDCFRDFVQRRGRHEPVAYLTGVREFWSLPFAVGPSVLIPRPETEWVVETALRCAPQFLRRQQRCRVLDIGTGSGNIAIAMAASLPAVEVFAIDISPAALTVARRNAQACQVAERVHYVCGDLLGPWRPHHGDFDLLLANPPYIPAEEFPALPETVRCYEPRQALDGGAEGLLFYRHLGAEGAQYLSAGGMIIVEVGYRQAEKVSDLLQRTQQWEVIEIVKDYSGIERVVVAQRRQKGSGSAWGTWKSKVGSSFTGTCA